MLLLSRHSFARRFHVSSFVRELLKRPDEASKNALERNVLTFNAQRMAELFERKRKLTAEINECNRLRKLYEADREKSLALKRKRQACEEDFATVEKKLEELALAVPNWSHPEAPLAEQGNRIIQQASSVSHQKAGLDHCEWNKVHGLIDFEAAATVSGAHFVALRRTLALLELALLSWSVSKAVARGFDPISVPDLVKEQHIYASGFHPRQSATTTTGHRPIFKVDQDELALAGTSEVYLAAQHANRIFSLTQLPCKQVAWSHCFRSEVGHHSATSRGLYRLHQFSKVELFVLCQPEQSEAAFDAITALQQEILTDLQLPFRKLEMHRGELGASAARKWDHEVWLPGRGIWGEVMSTSNCTDFQSRRLNIRLRKADGTLVYPHTLNGTAIAVPRVLMALIENGWREGNRQLDLPAVLKPFMPCVLEEAFVLNWK